MHSITDGQTDRRHYDVNSPWKHFSANVGYYKWQNRPITCEPEEVILLARDSIYAIARYMPSPVRLSICLSVCHTGGSVKDV